MEPASLIVKLRGTGGDAVRLAGAEMMKAFSRTGFPVWGRAYRRDYDGITRFFISAGGAGDAVIGEKTDIEADFDAGALTSGGFVKTLPPGKNRADNSERFLYLAGAAAAGAGLVSAGASAPFLEGFEYGRANFPGRDVPESGVLEERYLHTGRSAAALGAFSADCRYVASAVSFPEAKSVSDILWSLDRAPDAESAMYQAAGGALCGTRSMAVIDELSLRQACDAYVWAARAGAPMVVLVLDAGEAAFSHVASMYARSAFGLVYAPRTISEIYSDMAEAFASAQKYRAPVAVFADRLLTERWECMARPLLARRKNKADSGGILPGDKGAFFKATGEGFCKTPKIEMEMEPGCAVQWEGEPKNKTVFAVWGGADAPLRWALNRLGKNGEASVASLRSLQPFLSPESYGDFALCENLVTVESTAGEPLARWLRMAAGVQAKKSVRLDRAQEGEQTLQKIKEALDGG